MTDEEINSSFNKLDAYRDSMLDIFSPEFRKRPSFWRTNEFAKQHPEAAGKLNFQFNKFAYFSEELAKTLDTPERQEEAVDILAILMRGRDPSGTFLSSDDSVSVSDRRTALHAKIRAAKPMTYLFVYPVIVLHCLLSMYRVPFDTGSTIRIHGGEFHGWRVLMARYGKLVTSA